MRRITVAFGLLVFTLAGSVVPRCQEPQKATPCQLKNNPAAYNHKLIEVTGFVSHGFEDFGLFEPTCSSWPYVWLEYGGTVSSGTMYCCGVTTLRNRPKELEVEKMPIPLVTDERFWEFDSLIQRTPDSVVHATIIGRFFAGRKIRYPRGTSWGGYGHMGCCSLLAIQQLVSVDPHDRGDVDYSATPDQPRADKVGCGYRDLLPIEPYSSSLYAQRTAESGEHTWAFTDPQRVASDSLARLLKVDESSIQGMKQTDKVQGRLVYEWSPLTKKVFYLVVVSRPYWLSFYSSDSKKVAWTVLAVYESSCGKGNNVIRIR